ncbi:uncharacterized protein LOC123543177 [Mercenaria mercenaria]|uniref:uncharacterized protein LOC123543177 n=1 Tax=Mercenaria mercenaria TaxID=6596 RepID=UPI00234E89AD|nr:uncharacterized protein LOC123543177 [Mercenaria mercenaria]XP_053404702.1 uncharacterized protein LOC123543177 [Mercenaria mercenaria]XP_053404703.1 uncharacterized protein LOC123543177 [Mercenaria mercenaria]XP_053404704.1 uncharacterized protein LOC123543177 [Mercenaria mercenaria]XP_053404705.1 uncharacterized protein LOC123543177 [Mercenaria mercenaria]XP_053404706.1 uncharacterized protein LOC123543177 [Mercenaria mercenaria]
MAEKLNHMNMETELSTAKSVLYSGSNTKHTLGLTEKLSDTSDMQKLNAVCSDPAAKNRNTPTSLDKQATSKTGMPREISDDALDMEEEYLANKMGRDIVDDLCVDAGAGGLVHVTEDNLRNQAASQSKTFAKASANFKTFNNLENTTKALDGIQFPCSSKSEKSTVSETVSDFTAATVSLKQSNKKVLVPRNNENHHSLPVKSAPVKGCYPNEMGIFKGFSLKEYLEHNFALSGEKFEPVLNVGNAYPGISSGIKLSHLKRATERLGITWEKHNGVLIPVSTEESLVGEESFVSNTHWFGGPDINGEGVGTGPELPSNSNQTSTRSHFSPTETKFNVPSVVTEISSQSIVNPLSHSQGSPENLPSQGPVNPLSQTAKDLTPKVQAAGNLLSQTSQDVIPQAVENILIQTNGNLLPQPTQNFPHHTAENFHPQAAEQLPLWTAQNLTSKETDNHLYQELQYHLSRIKQNLQPQSEGNAQTQTATHFQQEAGTFYTGSGNSMSVCSETLLSANRIVSNINTGTNATLRPDPLDKFFYTCHPKIRHALHNMVCPSKDKGQQELRVCKTCSCPRYHPYQKTREDEARGPYQTSLPLTLTDP